jgi:hypothetical protein
MDPSPSEPIAPPIQPQPASSQQPTWNEGFSQVDAYADQLRVKLPLAPPGLLNAYMNVAPWVAIVFGVLGALISLAALIFSTALGPLMVMFGQPGSGFALILGSLLALVIAALEIAGGIMMLQRKATGWWLLAVGMVVSLLSSLLHTSALGLIFWVLIAYIHLQVKPNYTN